MTDMEKVETDNIAVVQARALKKYCEDHEGCCSCVFNDYDDIRILRNMQKQVREMLEEENDGI